MTIQTNRLKPEKETRRNKVYRGDRADEYVTGHVIDGEEPCCDRLRSFEKLSNYIKEKFCAVVLFRDLRSVRTHLSKTFVL